MKKIIRLFLSIILLISIFVPFVVTTKVEAATRGFSYGILNDTYVTTRTCPSYNCEAVRHDEGGIIYLSSPRVVEVTDVTGEWAKISYNYWGFSYSGWMYKQYLDIYTAYIDEEYENDLRRKGFPDSYVEKLAKMHAMHPTWNFEPVMTNISLEEAANGEYSPVSKNLISTTNLSQLSTDGAAYSNGTYIQFEPGWYAASRDTIKYYLDARNFLDDNQVFMFEQISYNSNVTVSDVQKILDGTFMEGSFDYNGRTYTFAEAMIEIGRETNVNPVHLAARALQESGTRGSATTDMDGGDGQIYHNYYNFNAYGSTVSEIVSNALSYAKANGWNNPYLAIKGGASGISNGYIDNNQDTLFFEKFNLVGDSRYWHQYMSNVQAPYQESYSTYISYQEAGQLGLAFTFKIPVYTDMGPTTIIATKSNNNNLNSLKVSACDITPSFNSAITTYSCTVENNVSNVDITGTKGDSKATVTGLGNVNLNVGGNRVEVIVTAEDGSKKSYVINITRKELDVVTGNVPGNEIISGLGLSNDSNNVSGFKLGNSISDVKDLVTSKYTSASIKILDSNNNEINSGIIATGQKIVITTDKTYTYTIVVKGDTSGDGKISVADYAKIRAHIQNSSKLSDIYLKAADINKDGSISVSDYAKVRAHIQGSSKIEQ